MRKPNLEDLMKGKYLTLAAILGGLTLFVWGFIWHAALPVYDGVLFEFADSQAVNSVIQQNTPQGNGMYWTPQGAFVAVAFTPDMIEKTQDMGAMLPIELVCNILTAFLFAAVIGRTASFGSIMKGALFLGMLGLTAEIALEASYWNWYGFSTGFFMVNLVGEVLAWFLAGLVVSASYMKFNK
jgi:hypothetical protein